MAPMLPFLIFRSPMQSCVFLGSAVFGIPASNIGVVVQSDAQVAILSTLFAELETGISITGAFSNMSVVGCNFDLMQNCIVATGGSTAYIDGCNFTYNIPGSVNVAASQANTNIYTVGCSFNCADTRQSARDCNSSDHRGYGSYRFKCY